MNILYIAHRIPYPPDKGDKLRAFRHIERLARRHAVWCACFVDTPSDFRHLPALRHICREVEAIGLHAAAAKLRGLWNLARGGTVTEGFYQYGEMVRNLEQWAKAVDFDAVIAFSSSMAPYARNVPARRRILDLCDCDSGKWSEYADRARWPMRSLYRAEGARLARREWEWIDAFDEVTVITEAERKSLTPDAPTRNIHVVGNGVMLPAEPPYHRPDSPAVGFVGVMDYPPNVDAVIWFVRKCWPLIRSAVPGAVFRVIGRSPTRSVRRLTRIPGVQVLGAVENAAAEVARLEVSVAPLRIARGLQNKVLEAMAAAKPVVLTTQAAAGIGAVEGRDYTIADAPKSFAQAVVRLLNSQTDRDQLGRSARKFVAEHHRWEDVLDHFEEIVMGTESRGESNRNLPWVTPSVSFPRIPIEGPVPAFAASASSSQG